MHLRGAERAPAAGFGLDDYIGFARQILADKRRKLAGQDIG